MANTILHKRSSTASAVPAAGSLTVGELAINTADGKLYTKKSNGTVVEVGAGGGGGSNFTYGTSAPASPTAGDFWFNSTLGVLLIYINDGNTSQWIEAGSGIQGLTDFTVSTTAPSNPENGDRWFKTDIGVLLTYVNDGNTSQWIETGIGSESDAITDTIGIMIDNTPESIEIGKKGFRQIPYNCEVVGWTIISEQTGSIQFDVKKSSLENYPNTVSIIGTNVDYPDLVNQSKSFSTSTGDWDTLAAGDIVDFVINSNSGIQKVALYIKTRRI